MAKHKKSGFPILRWVIGGLELLVWINLFVGLYFQFAELGYWKTVVASGWAGITFMFVLRAMLIPVLFPRSKKVKVRSVTSWVATIWMLMFAACIYQLHVLANWQLGIFNLVPFVLPLTIIGAIILRILHQESKKLSQYFTLLIIRVIIVMVLFYAW